jgi:phosphohistidine phosphatase
MKLVLIRHADAAPGDPDELRALTPEGHEQARRLGEQLRSDGVRPDAVLSSPLLRARQTASDLGFGAPEAVELLAPGAGEAEVRDAIAGRGETVVVVAHQPDCSRVAAALSGGPEPAFPPAGVQIIEL